MNELEPAKNEILKAMSALELSPLEAEKELGLGSYCRIPLSRLAALGTGLEPVASAIQRITGGEAASGIYKVTVPKGTHLAKLKNESGYIGSVIGSKGVEGQARLKPLLCNPTMLLAAAALAGMDRKLDDIRENQQEMLDFLTQKEKSALKADLDFLMDIYNNYKYNWNNEKYKSANHAKALDIRQEAARQIDFYQEQIKKGLGRKTLLHADQNVQALLDRVQSQFREYQLALYIYGFAYFLEIVLQESFEEAYLSGVSKKIDGMSLQYRELYSEAYSRLEGLSQSSLQSHVFGGLSAINRVTGEAIAKMPVISRSQIDETLIRAGEKIGEYKQQRVQTAMKKLLDRQSSCVRPFIDNIDMLNRLYNGSANLMFDNEALYIGAARQA